MPDTITPAALSACIADPAEQPFVIDVRPPAEYEAWHVPGSENLDLHEELRTDPEAAEVGLATIPDDREVVVVCTAGAASERAAPQLCDMGYDVKTLACHRP